jgi:hypothetical protein
MRELMLSALCTLALTTTAFASTTDLASTFSTEIKEIPLSPEEHELLDQNVDPGEIIATAERIVALGESIYTLVQKGKPTSQTKYAPISVVPIDMATKEPVHPFDLEDGLDPVRKKFVISKKNGFGNEVGRIDFLLHFTPGKSYGGKGQYITNASLIPLKANALYGWDISATMEVAGIDLKGKKDNPLATATLALNYKLNSVLTALNETVVIDIDGKGKVVVSE